MITNASQRFGRRSRRVIAIAAAAALVAIAALPAGAASVVEPATMLGCTVSRRAAPLRRSLAFGDGVDADRVHRGTSSAPGDDPPLAESSPWALLKSS